MSNFGSSVIVIRKASTDLTEEPENTLKIVRNREEVFWLIWLVGECEKVQIVTYG